MANTYHARTERIELASNDQEATLSVKPRLGIGGFILALGVGAFLASWTLPLALFFSFIFGAFGALIAYIGACLAFNTRRFTANAQGVSRRETPLPPLPLPISKPIDVPRERIQAFTVTEGRIDGRYGQSTATSKLDLRTTDGGTIPLHIFFAPANAHAAQEAFGRAIGLPPAHSPPF